jgi:glycosyltransferase involved in cell wall biosynthesis
MKKVLIITDNLNDQINGVVTTYKNVETYAAMDGYEFVYVDPSNFPHISAPKYPEVKLSFVRTIGKKIKKLKPAHIHIATEGPVGLAGRIWCDRKKIKYNTAYHTKFPEGIKKLLGIPEGITWRYVRWFHKHSGKVLTTTDSMVKELQAHKFRGNVVPWTRGVDRSIFDPALRKNFPAKYLLCVSRVSKEKNLEAFLELDYPGYQKIMVGDGPMLETYKKQYPNVTFTGFKTGVDLARYYANAEVFVFPSKWETFGIVMIEAMACGTPIAAYNCQGPADVIDQGVTGFMVEKNEGLATAVDKCLTISRQDVYRVSQRWSWERAWEIFRDNLLNTEFK